MERKQKLGASSANVCVRVCERVSVAQYVSVLNKKEMNAMCVCVYLWVCVCVCTCCGRGCVSFIVSVCRLCETIIAYMCNLCMHQKNVLLSLSWSVFLYILYSDAPHFPTK